MNFSNKSEFQMREYKIHKLHFDNPFIDLSDDSVELSYFAASKHEYSENRWNGSVAMGFRLTSAEDADEYEQQQTFFEAVIVGDFFANGDQNTENEADFIKKLRINGSSTLIPIVRAAVCSASALMGFPGKYTLPNINVFTLEWNDED